MGGLRASGMASNELSVLQKQLAVKTRRVQELQTQVGEKMCGLDDLEDELERKDRTIYYLERDMNFRSRNLGVIRQKNSNLEALAAKQNFSSSVDQAQQRVDSKVGEIEALEDQVDQSRKNRDHLNTLQELYEHVVQKLE